MDMVSERFILEYEVRDSIFFLPTIPCVLCVKCGRVFHSLSKDYLLFCFLFRVRFGVCHQHIISYVRTSWYYAVQLVGN